MYKGTTFFIKNCTSQKTIEAGIREGKNQSGHPNILFPANISVKNEGKIKTFYDK